MPAPTLTTLEQLARDYAQDNDANSSNYAFAQAAVWRIINRYYIQHKLAVDLRPQYLTATSSGLTFTDALKLVVTTPVNIRRIVNAWRATAVGDAAPIADAMEPLERCSEDELLEWTADYPYQTLAAAGVLFPKRWSAVRVGTATAASVGKWRVRLHPVPNTTHYVLLQAEIEPTALASGSDIPDLLDDEGYGLAALTGAWMALRMGRDKLVDRALAEVPQSMQYLAQSMRTQNEPARPAQESRP